MNQDYTVNWDKALQDSFTWRSKLRSFARNQIIATLSIVKKKERVSLHCLYCHYVFDNQIDSFEKILIKLKKIGTFINTDNCLQIIKGEKPLTENLFHLSFDDGFRNQYLNAFPVLQKLDIPCIFFIPTLYIDSDWSKAYEFCLKKAKYNKVIELLKWDDIKRMVQCGYHIGSHTESHARFADISHDLDSLVDEIYKSKLTIESKTGMECKYISWPFGKNADADAVSINFTAKVGYSACFGAFRGSISPKITNIYSIPRHHFEPQWPMKHVEYFIKDA